MGPKLASWRTLKFRKIRMLVWGARFSGVRLVKKRKGMWRIGSRARAIKWMRLLRRRPPRIRSLVNFLIR